MDSRALKIENDKRLDILFCCLEGTGFSLSCNLRTTYANITYANVKDEFEQRFFLDECKSNLQIKLQNLKLVQGTPVNALVTELRNTIRGLYGIEDSNMINDLLSTIHLLSTLDESLRGEAKQFQLTGNRTLENLLEFVNNKMGLQSFSHNVENAAIVGQNSTNNRLTRLQKMMELLTDGSSQNSRPLCSNCL